MSLIHKKLTTAYFLAVVLFLVDRIFQWQVLLKFGNRNSISILPGISLQLQKNTLFVFSLSLPPFLIYTFSLAVVAAVSIIYFKNFQNQRACFDLGYGFILGGALSNLFSRLTSGFVVDFIAVNIFGLQGVWNMADLLIVTGAILWLFGMEKGKAKIIS